MFYKNSIILATKRSKIENYTIHFNSYSYLCRRLYVTMYQQKAFWNRLYGMWLSTCFFSIIKGDFIAAFQMYPAIYTLLLLGLFLIAGLFVKFKYSEKIKIGLVILNLLIIVVSYIIKINQ